MAYDSDDRLDCVSVLVVRGGSSDGLVAIGRATRAAIVVARTVGDRRRFG